MKIHLRIRNRHLLIGDIFFIAFSIVLAYVLRLELFEAFIIIYSKSMLWMIGISLLIRPIVYYFFGLYRRMWIYASIQELKSISLAVTVASAIVGIIMLVLFNNKVFIGFPRSVIIIDWIQSIIFVGGLRFILRLLAESRVGGSRTNSARNGKRVLIIGAGDAGALVVKELLRNPKLNLDPIGFLDDNKEKLNQQIHGIPVKGTLKDLDRLVTHNHISEVIIAIPGASGRIVRFVADVCQKRRISFRTMPGLYELLGGKVSISRLREVEISDLLRRESVKTNDERVGDILTNKKVLVTGAGGSIGSELCRQIARWNPAKLILLGHGENSIFETYLELQENYPDLIIEAVIADIRDGFRIEQEILKHKPQVIFHAAAHKHVPLMEKNIEECVMNNVLGTQNILKSSIRNNVDRLVFISTDKAIRPANVMGATKRLAEMLILDAAERTGKAFSVVRFGNVLGSRGSVVPLFKRQIAQGGPITITHPEMKRYFMTIPEAVYLVLQASSIGKGGETFILNMGEQIKIVDLAKDLIRLSGLEPGRDIEITYTGVREGEKLSEDLWNYGRRFSKTEHPDIYFEEGQDELRGAELQSAVTNLLRLSKEGQTKVILSQLEKIIPDASVQQTHERKLSEIE